MENYIVRIYRRDEQNPDDVIGMVERVEWGDRQPFRSLSELCKFFHCVPQMPEGQKCISRASPHLLRLLQSFNGTDETLRSYSRKYSALKLGEVAGKN